MSDILSSSVAELPDAMQEILSYHSRGYQWWSCWHIDTTKLGKLGTVEKLERLEAKLAEDYGTRLTSADRQWRRQRGLPNASVIYSRVYSYPGRIQVMLLCQPFDRDALDKCDPFQREKWRTSPPEYTDLFLMSRELSEKKSSTPAWTWRIQNRRQSMMQNELLLSVKQGDRESVKSQTEFMAELPMFDGVRRQVRRMLRGAEKLWVATKKTPWPGPNPEALPAIPVPHLTNADTYSS